MSSSVCSVGFFLAVLFFCGVCGHSIVGRGPNVKEEFAVLSVPRFNISLLLDTRHRYITVRVAEDNTCYMVSLSDSLFHTPLRLIVHIYRQGGSVIQSEFRIQREVDRAWIENTLSREHIRFCHHLRTFLLHSAPGFRVNMTTKAPDTNTDSSHLIG